MKSLHSIITTETNDGYKIVVIYSRKENEKKQPPHPERANKHKAEKGTSRFFFKVIPGLNQVLS